MQRLQAYQKGGLKLLVDLAFLMGIGLGGVARGAIAALALCHPVCERWFIEHLVRENERQPEKMSNALPRGGRRPVRLHWLSCTSTGTNPRWFHAPARSRLNPSALSTFLSFPRVPPLASPFEWRGLSPRGTAPHRSFPWEGGREGEDGGTGDTRAGKLTHHLQISSIS